jgi:DNA-binding beta-propeller fold protein YncE
MGWAAEAPWFMLPCFAEISSLAIARPNGRQALAASRTRTQCLAPGCSLDCWIMKTMFRNGLNLLTVVTVVLCFAGCATKKPAPKNYTFFPPSPDEPRIQYLWSFGSESDLGSRGKFTDFIVGKERAFRPIVKPYGIALRRGVFYVTDTQLAALHVADLAKHQMRLVREAGQGSLRLPVNVAVDDGGTCYVADAGRGEVVIYGQDLSVQAAIGKKTEMKPSGIAVAGDRLYVTDMTNHCVRVYNKTTRELLLTVPHDKADEKARLFGPTNVAVDSQGRIYVADTQGFVVKIFDAQGNFLRKVGELGVTPGQFALPKGVAVDREGRLYVVDAAAPVIQLFDADGKLLMYFGQPDKSGPGALYLPAGIAIDYENVGLFQKYVAPGFKLEYLLLVVNQLGPNKVSVYGFLRKA